jgi:hypothetical protein
MQRDSSDTRREPLAEGRKDSLANFVEPLWGQTPLEKLTGWETFPEQMMIRPEYY